MDNDGNSYVLGTDGPRMAVRRFTPQGEPDSAWARDGVYNMNTFTSEDAVDIPKAMIIDPDRAKLFVAGSSGDEWAVARVNIPWGSSGWAWHAHFLTGTADALWLDSSQDKLKLGVAGTTRFSNNRGVALFTLWGDGAMSRHVGSALLTGRTRVVDLAQSLALW